MYRGGAEAERARHRYLPDHTSSNSPGSASLISNIASIPQQAKKYSFIIFLVAVFLLFAISKIVFFRK